MTELFIDRLSNLKWYVFRDTGECESGIPVAHVVAGPMDTERDAVKYVFGERA